MHHSSNTQQTPVSDKHGATSKPPGGHLPVPPTPPDKLIRIKAVCELCGLGKTSVYSIPDFPKRVVLSRRAVGWRLSEVQAWIESRSAVEGA